MSLTAITMPKWGLTMTEGKVVGWLKTEGETFAPGDELLEIETSKITNVLEAESSGTLLRVVAKDGAVLPIGGLLAVVAPPDTPAADVDAFVAQFAVAAEPADADDTIQAAAPRDIDVAGLRIRMLEQGSGDGVPVLLVHGFGGDLNSWMFTQPALAEGRRVIAFDLPGHGGSAKQAADMVAVTIGVMDALGLDRAHLVGHSLGGAITALVAAQRPARVASLTLIAPAGFGPDINAAFIDGFVQLARRKEATDILKLLVDDPTLVSRTMIEDVLRYKRLDGVVPALQAIAADWFPRGRQARDLTGTAAALPMPVQAIWGRNDRIVPASHAAALPGAHVLDGAGHLPHMEKSAEVTRLIRHLIEA